MRFKLNPAKTAIRSVNRGGIRSLPDMNGVFDTDLYQDNISVDAGSMAKSDGKYTERISDEQVASAKKEVEELITYWDSTGIAEILDKPKAKADEAKAKQFSLLLLYRGREKPITNLIIMAI